MGKIFTAGSEDKDIDLAVSKLNEKSFLFFMILS